MPPPRRAPIPGVTASLADVLQQLEEWERDAGMAGEDHVIDYRVVCLFSGPNKKPHSIPREYLKPGAAEEWPMPGDYEIRVVDSNGDLITDAWTASHFDKETLTRARSTGDDFNPIRLMLDANEDNRIQIRHQRAWVNEAEAREQKAKAELRLSEDRVTELQRKLTAAEHAKGKAEAERDVALEQRQEAVEAAELLEEELATFKAPIAMFVDEGLAKLSQFFGVGVPAANTTGPSSSTAPAGNGDPDVSAAGAAAAPGAGNPNPDPPPPLADDPMQAVQDLGMLFERCIFDREVLRQLVEAGVLEWEHVRRLVWYRLKVDLGPVPKWTEWAAGDAPPAAPPAQQGAA